MPTFEITAPDGQKYSVTGPDGSTEQQALANLQSMLAIGGKNAQEPPTPTPISLNDVVRSAGDLPILGPLIERANAATNAALAPIIDPLLPASFEKLPGKTFRDRYSKALELQQAQSKRFQEQYPIAAATANIGGTIGATIPLAATGAGAAVLGLGARTLPRMMGLQGLSGAGIGATDAAIRGNDIGMGGLLGGGLGAAAPAAGRAISTLASPVISNISARINSEGFARRQFARGLMESGQTPQQIDDAIAAANREGQGMFTAADAMGNAGQRLLSTVTRAPGIGRTEAVNFLEQRQAGQGRRVANQLAEGFDSPRTAAQVEDAMTRARRAQADVEFGAARANANPVDLTSTIRTIDDTLAPGVNQIASPASGIANDSIEAALEGVRRRLTDNRSMLTDFTAVQRVRGDLGDMVEAARRAGQGNRARLLGGVLRRMDDAMEAASTGYRAANANFSRASRNIERIGEGRDAAMRGRTEDIIPAFRRLSPEGQGAFRAGYVDPLIAQTQGAASGANKARPLINDAFQAEAAAIAPMRTNARMQRQLAREQTMFETRAHALGGSRTADNLADAAAVGIDPSIIGNVLSGNYMGAMRGMLGSAMNALGGNTPAVREQIGRILLSRGNVPAARLQTMIDQTMRRLEMLQRGAEMIGRGATIGTSAQMQ